MIDKYCSECGKKLRRDNPTDKCKSHSKNEYYREWRRINQDKIREYRNSEEVQIHRRKYFLMYNRGIDWDTYTRMYESQDGNCACCGDALDMYAKSTVVDHDHETGKVRSILCTRCNMAAGFVKDNSDRAKKLVEYLIKFGK